MDLKENGKDQGSIQSGTTPGPWNFEGNWSNEEGKEQ